MRKFKTVEYDIRLYTYGNNPNFNFDSHINEINNLKEKFDVIYFTLFYSDAIFYNLTPIYVSNNVDNKDFRQIAKNNYNKVIKTLDNFINYSREMENVLIDSHFRYELSKLIHDERDLTFWFNTRIEFTKLMLQNDYRTTIKNNHLEHYLFNPITVHDVVLMINGLHSVQMFSKNQIAKNYYITENDFLKNLHGYVVKSCSL